MGVGDQFAFSVLQNSYKLTAESKIQTTNILQMKIRSEGLICWFLIRNIIFHYDKLIL